MDRLEVIRQLESLREHCQSMIEGHDPPLFKRGSFMQPLCRYCLAGADSQKDLIQPGVSGAYGAGEKAVWNLLIGFIISIYLLSSKELFAAQAKKIVYAFYSVESANRFISNVRFAHKTFGGFFVGKILDSIIIGILCFVITSILGMPFCVLISVIIGVTNIIPFFGPFLGAIPSILLILFVDPLKAVYFAIFVIILQQVL